MGTGGHRAARLVAGAGLLVVATFVAACASESATPTSSTSSSAVPSTTAGGGDQPAVVELPVRLAELQGSPRVTATVSVGGTELEVLVDTGSAGLLLDGDAVGGLAADGPTTSLDVAAGTLTVASASAPVGLGSITTDPIAVGVIQGMVCGSGESCDRATAVSELLSGTEGILGIGLSDDDSTATVVNPLLQLPDPYGVGYELDLTGDSTVLRIGSVSVGSDSVTVPFEPLAPATFPDGTPAYSKDATLCWTIGASQGCGLTDMDSGSPVTALASDALDGLPASGDLPSGTAVSVAPGPSASGPSGALWSFTSGTTEAIDLVEVVPTLPPPTTFNTGLGFFREHVLGYDLDEERFVITPG